ncbi:MAG: prepilin-type N-terminal cleavage/methylation domain-containing protein [Planctomycetota bacterium]|nr:prepilin-type N-terminal cleavage/methylation domain-containing protein [Planctomycetota bacterium]
MRYKPGRTQRAAFTLIELLVVISIIGVLLGILLPTLAGARKRAHTVACMSNTGQVVKSMNTFATDNKGRLPENRTLVSPTEHVTWRAQFAKAGYIPVGKSWLCPGYRGEMRGEKGAFDNNSTCVDDVPSNYAMNGHLVWKLNKTKKDAERNDGAILRPSHTILITESAGDVPDMRVTNELLAIDYQGTGFYGYWHAGKGNYGFQDGHVETLNLLDTGNPDCRWHNGKDYEQDMFSQQDSKELGVHSHPDWEYLVNEVYLKPPK